MKDSIYRLNLRQLGTALREGSLSAIAVLDHYLDRIGRLDGELNCFAHVDVEGARAAARLADERLASGKPLGPLDGIPVAIKDNLLVAGMPCVWGTKLYRDYIAEEDELPVRLLRQAGAVIVGKTNVPEFTLRGFTGNAVFGSTGNPWNPAVTPGGSSGGSVAAVAAGYVGIVGLKPSIGCIPRQGGLPPLLADCEVVGPLARTVDDIRLILSVIGRANSADPRSFGFPAIDALSATPEPKRILFVERFGDAPVDPEIAALCSRAADRFAALGHEVERGALPLDLKSVNAGWPILANTGLAKMAALDPRFLQLVSAPFSEQAKAGAKLSATDYLTFIETLDAFRVAAARLLETFDVVLTPASAAHPWPRDTQFPPVIDGKEAGPRGHAVFTNWMNACGHPGISIPVGPGTGGMPVGLQAVAAFGADDALLDFAASFEQVHPWADRWPELAVR
ncbi:amidase [Agrobacterium rosae]|uniref:Amidase n=1 Tax=Agrobacterium rosae TaxID=1972867 RepID=A0AAW9FIP3_9HYPH|nr:amidase [Agrobacterium rosae]MDX8304422.1 amidase [Agrobacterium rosae]